MCLTPFERELLEAYLTGDYPGMHLLRKQLTDIHVKSREYTSAGFFVELEVEPGARKISGGDCHMGDVNVKIPALQLGLGTVLFIKDGFLDLLEGFTYGEGWNCKTDGYSIEYREGSGGRSTKEIPEVLKEGC